MKIVALYIVFGFLFLNLSAQEAKWDSTYRPGAFKLELAKFKSYKNKPTDIIFLGNSITAHANWAELLQNPCAKNRGISGDITFGVLERLSEVTKGNPAKVFLLIGVNDISRNIPDSIIVDNISKIVDRIQKESLATVIYIETVLPVNNTFTKFKNHYNKDEHISAVNVGIKNIAKTRNVNLIDSHQFFLDEKGKLHRNYTHDGLHLTENAYLLWAKELKKYLQE